MAVTIVTGYVPDAFPARHLSQQQFAELGERLVEAIGPGRMSRMRTPWDECWAAEIVRKNPGILPSCANPPADRFATPGDMVRSNVVLLQRFLWLAWAAEDLPPDDTVAWIEWSVMKQTGVTAEVLRGFVEAVDRDPPTAITCPGCWPVSLVNDSDAHWRFVGSCFLMPARMAAPLFTAVKFIATMRAEITGRLSWDMNTLAIVELASVLPFQWYPAGHDATQFTRYGERK